MAKKRDIFEEFTKSTLSDHDITSELISRSLKAPRTHEAINNQRERRSSLAAQQPVKPAPEKSPAKEETPAKTRTGRPRKADLDSRTLFSYKMLNRHKEALKNIKDNTGYSYGEILDLAIEGVIVKLSKLAK